MAIRYSILPYMYTLFYQAHTTGSTVMRALSWEFPNDPSLADADRQFMLGPSIMVIPVRESIPHPHLQMILINIPRSSHHKPAPSMASSLTFATARNGTTGTRKLPSRPRQERTKQFLHLWVISLSISVVVASSPCKNLATPLPNPERTTGSVSDLY